MTLIQVPSPNFNERALDVNTILIHYTDMPTAQKAVHWLSNPLSQVSAHYLIDEEGQTYQLVREEKRAWHAGESYWQGCTDLNSCSIGIELANRGHHYGYLPFPIAQINALLRLCEGIKKRWYIPTSRFLGHSDVAPRRKQDPGHLFPWKTFAKEGLGLWPNDNISSTEIDILDALSTIGYETVSPSHTFFAFQRHFQPQKIDGIFNEETISLLKGLFKTIEKPI
ncbi:MAG: N-acetylmuramoyl-L-alanine amidase [Alphaproteobacteria bacterium]|nr:N-acetylmuramoyl-L-alanine amidase [Alphaproteobacteria bacterium]